MASLPKNSQSRLGMSVSNRPTAPGGVCQAKEKDNYLPRSSDYDQIWKDRVAGKEVPSFNDYRESFDGFYWGPIKTPNKFVTALAFKIDDMASNMAYMLEQTIQNHDGFRKEISKCNERLGIITRILDDAMSEVAKITTQITILLNGRMDSRVSHLEKKTLRKKRSTLQKTHDPKSWAEMLKQPPNRLMDRKEFDDKLKTEKTILKLGEYIAKNEEEVVRWDECSEDSEIRKRGKINGGFSRRDELPDKEIDFSESNTNKTLQNLKDYVDEASSEGRKKVTARGPKPMDIKPRPPEMTRSVNMKSEKNDSKKPEVLIPANFELESSGPDKSFDSGYKEFSEPRNRKDSRYRKNDSMEGFGSNSFNKKSRDKKVEFEFETHGKTSNSRRGSTERRKTEIDELLSKFDEPGGEAR